MKIKTNDIGDINKISCVEINNIDVSIKEDANIDELIKSSFWPEALPSALIASEDAKVRFRSKTIVRSYVGNVTGKKILDFGCGNGYCTREAISAGAAISVGYDIKRNNTWDEAQPSNLSPAIVDPILTTDFDEVLKYAPYDIILMYDVVDHIKPDEVNDAISKVISACDYKTFVKVRCHPWTSIHGGHIYEKLNRAYGHLLLSDDGLAEYQSEYVNKITRPIATYNKVFDKFTTLNTNINKSYSSDNVSNVMKDKSIVNRLQKSLGGDGKWQSDVLPIEFVDYLLSKK